MNFNKYCLGNHVYPSLIIIGQIFIIQALKFAKDMNEIMPIITYGSNMWQYFLTASGKIIRNSLHSGITAIPELQKESMNTGGAITLVLGLIGYLAGIGYNYVENIDAEEEQRKSGAITWLPLLTGVGGLLTGFLLESGALLLKY